MVGELKELNGYHNMIISIIDDFERRMLEALEWTKNHLNQHFLHDL
jgi:hypothetical protein